MPVRRVTDENRAAIVAEAAAILNGGGVVLMPTDTVYGLAAHPARLRAVDRLYAIKGRANGKPIALLAADGAAIVTLGGHLSPTATRFAQAFWPGALTLVVSCGGVREGIRVPDHSLARELIAACGGLLRVTSANRSGDAPAQTAQEALQEVGRQVDLVIDAGPVHGGTASTVVLDDGAAWKILRQGAVKAEELERVAAGRTRSMPDAPPNEPRPTMLLFVCTGNTCRSPMAEVLLRAHLSVGSPWRVTSAGTHATPGQPASPLAQQAIAARGLSLARHRSRLLTREIAEEAAVIVALGRSHFDYVAALTPAAHDKVFSLRRFAAQADGMDIQDPIGGTLSDYGLCRDAISRCLPGLVRFLSALA